MARHRWTAQDAEITRRAAATGLLPDGRTATQGRLALLLGCSRKTVNERLQSLGISLPTAIDRIREGARSSAYIRRVRRVVTILQQSGRLHR